MEYLGDVGNTFRLRDRHSFSVLYVILTKPNHGEVVVVSLVKPLKSVQSHGVYTAKDEGNLFRIPRTPNYPDASFYPHRWIIDHLKANPDMRDHDCPLDIVNRIVARAFVEGLSPNKVLDELSRQYPHLK